ncbi:sulfurtransferase [Paenibacillus sp. p3-SID867]|uniref:sulfurtransferase n=1 Tax=Paenibacillus sp. p3-SID867 TaxID=2916363 RepID=UPI0021A8A9A8|nr:sulfurtransferase [Paenibacillus sp. p3-SID867]MCT1401772.1 sulfurtransferase [Paenibacillus sp. p3-SID867]
MSNLVSKEWVLKQLESNPDQLVIADVRFSPGNEGYGLEAYQREHVPGAVFIDLKKDLMDPPGEHGGRSPLPQPDELARRLGNLGIDTNTPVVVYDDDLRPEGARLWWILKYLGHGSAFILDGGYAGWKSAGYPLISGKIEVTPRSFQASVQEDWLADVNEVRVKLGAAGVTLLDSRDWKQFTGETAPLDPVAGHIPGAVHAYWKDGVDEDGTLKGAERQRERFAGIDPDHEVIVYCGSGLSACPNVLALREAGYRNVKLYAGSWSDWISYKENEIAAGEA